VLLVINRIKANTQADVLSYNDYTALGYKIFKGSDRDLSYGYQGATSSEDDQTGWNSFELRMYDSRIGRWLSVDPYQQYWSPYMAMGNDWINYLDIDGGKAYWHRGKKGELIADPGDNLATLVDFLRNESSLYANRDYDDLFEKAGKVFHNLANWDDYGFGVRGGASIDGRILHFEKGYFKTDQTVSGRDLNWRERWAETDNLAAQISYGIVNDPYVAYQSLFNLPDRHITAMFTGELGDYTVRNLDGTPATATQKQGAFVSVAADVMGGKAVEAIAKGGLKLLQKGGKALTKSVPQIDRVVNASKQAIQSNQTVRRAKVYLNRGGTVASRTLVEVTNAAKTVVLDNLIAVAVRLDNATLGKLSNWLLKQGMAYQM